MADLPKKLSMLLLESYKHHLSGLLHNNNSLYITYANGMEAYGENFVYNMLGIENQITPKLADLNNSDDLQDFALDYDHEYDLTKIDPKHYKDAAVSEHLYLAIIDNGKRSIVNPRELFDFDYDLGVDNLHENLHDFALNLYQKDQNWHELVNHPRLKSEAWWLSRKNLARTPTNLDRNNLTKFARNLTSGYLITKAINPRVARRIIQFSIVV